MLILMLGTNSAMAEEKIVLPAGLEFGMRLDEAIAVSGYDKRYAPDVQNEIEFDTYGYSFDWLYGKATVAGMDVSVYVYFDEKADEQNLIAVTYALGSEEDANATAQEFAALDATLEKTYGAAREIKHQHMPKAYQFTRRQSFGNTDKSFSVLILNQYYREYDDDTCVVIDHCVLREYTNASYSTNPPLITYPHRITYTHYDFTLSNAAESSPTLSF